MPAVVRELERVGVVAPLGVRFRDTVTGAFVSDGLRVVAYPAASPERRTAAIVNRSAVFVAHHLPGLRDAERGDGDEAYWASVARRRFVVEVVDGAGRFLPFTFAADLPARGLVTWDDPAIASPPSPPSPPTAVPLFPAPSRSAAAGMAAVRAELWDPLAGAPAAWAVLTVTPPGGRPARGVADARGRVVVFLPYPEPIDAIPNASPPSGPPLTEQAWELDLQVQYAPAPGPPTIRDLHDTLGQPAGVLWSSSARTAPLAGATLRFGRELVLRSSDGATGRALPVVHVTPGAA